MTRAQTEEIAHRWARAAFGLIYSGAYAANEPVPELRRAIGDRWYPMDYSRDPDEIIETAILEAIKEVQAT